MSDIKIMVVIIFTAMVSWASLLAIPFTLAFKFVADLTLAGFLENTLGWLTLVLIFATLLFIAFRTCIPAISWLGRKYQRLAEWILKRKVSLE